MGRRKNKISTFSWIGIPFYFWFDILLVLFSLFTLFSGKINLLVVSGILGLFPVLWSAAKALFKKRITIDLLASVALIFSLLNAEFQSAVFISFCAFFVS